MNRFQKYYDFFFTKERRLRPIKELFYDIFIRNTDLTIVQFLRGIFVGGACVILDMFTLGFLVEYIGDHHLQIFKEQHFTTYVLVANAIAFIFGTTLNYILSILWIFTKQSAYSRKKEFIIYTFIGIIGLALNSLFMFIFIDMFEIFYMTSKIITIILVYAWNFFSRKYIIFK